MSKAKWPTKVRIEGGDRIVYRTCPYCGEEFSSDKCLAAALDEIIQLRTASFALSPEESKRAKTWCKQHGKRHQGRHNSWTYRFTCTGVGTKVEVVCSCGAEKDVTDYEQW